MFSQLSQILTFRNQNWFLTMDRQMGAAGEVIPGCLTQRIESI